MIRFLRRQSRLAAPLVRATALALIVGLTATPAFAQNDPNVPPGEEKAEGRSGDGYIATGCLAGLALFLIAKSARRQIPR